jgi:hypothetical protein
MVIFEGVQLGRAQVLFEVVHCLFSDMWELATQEINRSLYAANVGLYKPADKDCRLLTAYPPYNEAYLNPAAPELRRKLFASYEQLENKC